VSPIDKTYNKLYSSKNSKNNYVNTVSMSNTFIGGAVFREFESEAPAGEEMLDRVVCSTSTACMNGHVYAVTQ